jgi:tetratricopeptide (TPR) repeat protein
MLRHCSWICLFLTLFNIKALWAEPYIPKHENEVLERLPVAITPVARELRGWRSQLEQNPHDLALASQLAWRYIGLGRSEADPRYFGYAEGVLQPWWNIKTPPNEILLLRATLRQNRHEFASVLEDLQYLLSADPRNSQGWLTQATIQQVQGNYAMARLSCIRLMTLADRLISLTCLSNVMSLSGQQDEAYRVLSQALIGNDAGTASEIRLWSVTTLAEIAARMGKNDDAEKAYKQALVLGQRDSYLLASYADFLLDQGREDEVEALLKNETRIDGLLLRRVLALQRLNPKQASGLADMLVARFAASRARGENLHQGEEARFALHVLNDKKTALKLAASNWAVQKEPRDARILLEAAIAAKQLKAANPVIQFVEKMQLDDARLLSLLNLARGW